ncbi:uncharacterized protein BO87DRAFT_437087 [Aspergillus neoniger CBS 115656]|uniref:Uncharacterized protein n=1 Tax=Aspergillus neoniger (strain CBS 115656) TaxID=1448310 RepID=A0A318YJ52_ASPNB|nr:hypothetical protein BO87DRAFT_437087 [Aspergillus neoniger CBS 115656]PYH33787.1 hypothetical protein BO87DRAFT_437087 [Aspergillus neoniger CBS 115656]
MVTVLRRGNPPPVLLFGDDIVSKPLPELEVGPGHTTSCAIHEIDYEGPLSPWVNFEREVEQQYVNHNWRLEPVGATEDNDDPPPHSLSREQVYVGDENGVQGRFVQNVGQAVGSAFASQLLDVRFGDFKSSLYPRGYKKVPDSVMETAAGGLLAVGELKTPWAKGQIAKYMYDLKLKFGYMSNYDETIFFKQEIPPGRRYTVLYYSSIIGSDSLFVPGESVTLRQCFFHLGVEASAGPDHITEVTRTVPWFSG